MAEPDARRVPVRAKRSRRVTLTSLRRPQLRHEEHDEQVGDDVDVM